MEAMNKKESKDTCDCSGHDYVHRDATRRMILVVVVVIIAFWCGLQLGEIKGYLAASFANVPTHQRGVMRYDMGDRKEMPMKAELQKTPVPAETSAN